MLKDTKSLGNSKASALCIKKKKVRFLTHLLYYVKKYSYLNRLHYMGLLEQEDSYRYILTAFGK